MELFAANMKTLDDAVQIERLKMEKIGYEKDWTETCLERLRTVCVSDERPPVGYIPPQNRPWWYDKKTDTLWQYGDVGDRYEQVDAWTRHSTNASQYNAILRFYKEQNNG